MPLTPFHLAAGLPAKKYINIWAFIWANILIDLEPGLIMFFGMDSMGYPLHQGMHTFGGATLAIAVTLTLSSDWCFKKKIRPWIYGAVLGGYSHILLDALVHSDVEPFAPIMKGNPLYMDLHAEVTLVCGAVLTYYLAKWVISLRVGEVGSRFIQRIRGKFFSRTLGK